jgi:hypothetical protein
MRLKGITSAEDQSHRVLTYELPDGRRIKLDAKAVELADKRRYTIER